MARQHYWLNDEVICHIPLLENREFHGDSDGPVRHVWKSICSLYFIEDPDTPTGTLFTGYSVEQAVHRGPGCDRSSCFPAIVTAERHRVEGVQMRLPGCGEGPRKKYNLRDVLWVECKAPNLDQPGEWNELMNRIQAQLVIAHGTPDTAGGQGLRKVYFILAIGLKWMIFVWDPANTNAPLRFRKKNAGEYYDPLHPFIAAVQFPPGSTSPFSLPDGTLQQVQIGFNHVQRDAQGVVYVDSGHADSLDWWSQAPGQPGVPANLRSLSLLEHFFASIRDETFQDWNPPHWS